MVCVSFLLASRFSILASSSDLPACCTQCSAESKADREGIYPRLEGFNGDGIIEAGDFVAGYAGGFSASPTPICACERPGRDAGPEEQQGAPTKGGGGSGLGFHISKVARYVHGR